MARVLKASIKVPEFDYNDVEESLKIEDAFIQKLYDKSNKATPENPKGFILEFPIADGKAMYRVEKVSDQSRNGVYSPTNSFSMRHIPVGDAWQIDNAHARGLRFEDVLRQMRWRTFLNEKFGDKYG